MVKNSSNRSSPNYSSISQNHTSTWYDLFESIYYNYNFTHITYKASPKLLNAAYNDAKQINSNLELYLACLLNQLHVVKKYIESDNRNDLLKINALDIAASHGHLEMFISLLTYLNQDKQNKIDISSLFETALRRNHLSIVKYLNENFQGINNQYLVLYKAVTSNNVPLVKLLIKQGVNINAEMHEKNRLLGKTSPTCITPLMLAAQRGKINIVKLLLEHKVDVNKVVNGITALSYAVQKGNEEIVKLLLDAKADLNLSGVDKDCILNIAIKNGKMSIIELLIKHGADVNKNSNGGETPLFHSVRLWSNKNITKYLIKQGAKEFNAGTNSISNENHPLNSSMKRFLTGAQNQIHIEAELKEIPALKINTTPLAKAKALLRWYIDQPFYKHRFTNKDSVMKIYIDLLALKDDEFTAHTFKTIKQGAFRQCSTSRFFINVSAVYLNPFGHFQTIISLIEEELNQISSKKNQDIDVLETIAELRSMVE